MNDPTFMEVLEYRNNAGDEKSNLLLLKLFKFSDMITQISFFHEGQHQVQILIGLESRDERGNKRMMELGDNLPFIHDGAHSLFCDHPA
jgi:hypothetical protein